MPITGSGKNRGRNEPAWQKAARFWSKVSVGAPGACWEWKSGLDEDGYALFKVDRRTTRAARFSALLIFGTIAPGLWVLHSCDNRKCVNPHHLFLGSPSENSLDREQKGRGRNSQGSANGANKLTESDVLEIRAMYKNGFTQKEIAHRFNIDRANISVIVNRKTWRHI